MTSDVRITDTNKKTLVMLNDEKYKLIFKNITRKLQIGTSSNVFFFEMHGQIFLRNISV